MTDLSDRVILVTGAGGNLGRAVAALAHRRGASLALVDRSADKLASVAPEATAALRLGGIDLLDLAAVEDAVRQAVARFGRLDALVATVGAFRGGKPVEAEAWSTWELLLSANLRSAVVACRAALPHLTAPGGRIVTVAARTGLAGPARTAAYSAAKSGVIRLTESLAAEVEDRGITANCILPGTIDTPENRAAMPGADTGRWVEPEAIAEVILFLVSDAAGAVTGAAIPVTGRG